MKRLLGLTLLLTFPVVLVIWLIADFILLFQFAPIEATKTILGAWKETFWD